MEVRVQLKICEGCGCLWFRAQAQGSVYCRECESKLRDFPSPEVAGGADVRASGNFPKFGHWLKAFGGVQ